MTLDDLLKAFAECHAWATSLFGVEGQEMDVVRRVRLAQIEALCFAVRSSTGWKNMAELERKLAFVQGALWGMGSAGMGTVFEGVGG